MNELNNVSRNRKAFLWVSLGLAGMAVIFAAAGLRADGSSGTDTCQLKNGVDIGANCEIVTGTLEAMGTTDTYTFAGALGKRAFLDDQTTDTLACSNLQETLTGPGGPVFGPDWHRWNHSRGCC